MWVSNINKLKIKIIFPKKNVNYKIKLCKTCLEHFNIV